MSDEEFINLVERIRICSRPPSETFERLAEAEQQAWTKFFLNYTRDVLGAPEDDMFRIAGFIVQIWTIAHEYHRLYGPLWA